MKRLSALLPAVLLTSFLLRSATAGTAPDWRTWDAGLKEAASKGRPVLVDAYTDWCGWCKRMDRDVYSRPEVRDYLARRYVVVRINAERDDAAHYKGKAYTSRSLAGSFGIRSYPTTMFLKSSGEHRVNVPGYMPADKFLLVLRYIAEGYMDRGVPFEDFARDSKAASGGKP
jgi:thioredoxin-related protein